MSISEQVKDLQKWAEEYLGLGFQKISELLREAADTIESLSAKMADMERPAEDCGSGWIEYDFGKNPPKEDGYYWVTLIPNSGCGLKELFERMEKIQRFVRKVEYRNGTWKMMDITVIAWMPYYEPEPYHEP